MISNKIKTINTPEQKYNYFKSIKDKENIILSYYKKINHLENDKPKILPKIKKRTLKKIKIEVTNDTKVGNEFYDKEKEKEKDKKTKKQIVIMDD